MKLFQLLSLLSFFIEGTNQLSCDKQKDYFENERRLFNVPSYEEPFNYTEFSSKEIDCFPTNKLFCDDFPFSTTITPPLPNQRIWLNDFFVTQLYNVWKLLGWKQQYHFNEEYWFYNNTKTNNVVVFFHGLNGVAGLENIYLLSQLTKNASVYFSVYIPTFLLEQPYDHAYAEHIDNVQLFLQGLSLQSIGNTVLFGNSYGSIRLTTLCKRYDCRQFTKIVLTDPLNINLPFSNLYKHLAYGLFFNHTSSVWRQEIITVQALRMEKHYWHIVNNFNWYEWSIDTQFLEKYKHNLVLVIGEKDNLISVDKTSFALTSICKVIFTNTYHGFVIITPFLVAKLGIWDF